MLRNFAPLKKTSGSQSWLIMVNGAPLAQDINETYLRSVVIALVLVLISGCGSENTTTQWIQADRPAEALAHLKTQDIMNNIVVCLKRNGFPMQKEILYNGQVVNWIFTEKSSNCCRVKTSFRAFSSREAMQKSMMATNAASVQHGELDVAMFVPWTIRIREDCDATCSTSFEEELYSAFRACDGQESNG